MIDESGAISHIPCINSALWTAKIIEGVINTQAFSQNIDAMLNKLSTIDHE